MVATTVLLMVVLVAALLLVGITLMSRSRVRATRTAGESDGGGGWMPAVFSDGGSSDCNAGDAGCDGGAGGDGGGGGGGD